MSTKSISESNDSNDDNINYKFKINEIIDKEVNKEFENYVKSNDFFDNTKDVNQNTSELSVVPLFRQIIDYNSFKDLETNRLSELSSAINVFKYPLNINLIEITNISELYELYLHYFEKDINYFIEFAKQLKCFNELYENDKLNLVKYGCYEVTNFRSKLLCDRYRCYKRPLTNLYLVSI